MSTISFVDKITVEKGKHTIYHLVGKTQDGRNMHYYLDVLPSKQEAFMQALKPGVVLTDYGTLVAGYAGDVPDEESITFMRNNFGYDLPNAA